MPGKKVDFNVVREIALALPGVEETTLHDAPCFKVSGRLLASRALDKSAEPNTLVVRIDFNERTELLAQSPKVYYLTDQMAERAKARVTEVAGSHSVYVSK
jgi:hypothetical protein